MLHGACGGKHLPACVVQAVAVALHQIIGVALLRSVRMASGVVAATGCHGEGVRMAYEGLPGPSRPTVFACGAHGNSAAGGA